MEKLTAYEARLLSGATGIALAVVGGGSTGATLLRALVVAEPRVASLVKDSLALLAVAQEGKAGDDLVEISNETLDSNLAKLKQLAMDLLGSNGVEQIESTGQESFEPISPTGEAAGSKQYRLWLTHEEIHWLYYALRLAESCVNRDLANFIKGFDTYTELRRDNTTETFTSFVNKFDKVHKQAVEVDGMK